MNKDNVITLKDTVEYALKDTLTDLIRSTARVAIQEAVEAELKNLLTV